MRPGRLMEKRLNYSQVCRGRASKITRTQSALDEHEGPLTAAISADTRLGTAHVLIARPCDQAAWPAKKSGSPSRQTRREPASTPAELSPTTPVRHAAKQGRDGGRPGSSGLRPARHRSTGRTRKDAAA